MKIWVMLGLFWSLTVSAVEVVEIDINGMSCGFCVDAVRRKLSRLPDVEKARVSLKSKKVRIRARSDRLDLQRVRKTILDAGFTPSNIRRVDED